MTQAQLRQYIEDFERGLALRLDTLDTRLETIETDLAVIKEHLVTKMRADERSADPPFHEGAWEAKRLGELRLDPQFVAERLGLTPTESRVAVLLSQGHSVAMIASVTGQKQSTVRWFLKQINRKLGTSRQADLVRLVLLLHKGGDAMETEYDKIPDTENKAAASCEENPA